MNLKKPAAMTDYLSSFRRFDIQGKRLMVEEGMKQEGSGSLAS
jgi:hypothetical protein